METGLTGATWAVWLGILTSIFSAVFVSRGIVNLVYGSRRKLTSISVGQVWRGGGAAGAKA